MKKEKKKTPWTDEELKVLIRDSEKTTANQLSKKLNRTIYDLETKAKSLGIKFKKVNELNRWSEKDLEKLKSIGYKYTISQLTKVFPKRSYNSIWVAVRKHDITVKDRETVKKPKDKNVIEPESYNQYLIKRIKKLTKRRDEVLRELNGKYDEELYSELNSLNASLEKLKNQ